MKLAPVVEVYMMIMSNKYEDAQFHFFVLFLFYHFSCKLKIGNRIVKDPDEVAEDCMTL